jgi:antitoxin MazE
MREVFMKLRIQKWGNSLALRIPKSFAAETKIEQNTEVDLIITDGKLVVSPVIVPEWTLEDLLAGISPENLHGEIDDGPSVGSESW